MIGPFFLVHEQARNRAISAVRDAPEGWVVRIVEPKRSRDQNDKFHALCRDFSKSQIVFGGKERSEDEWKVLLVSGFAKSVGHNPQILEGLEGEPVALRESTASMVKRRMSDLIEYTYAIGSELGVKWSEPDGTE